MDLVASRLHGRGPVSSLTELPEYIISTFFPAAKPLLTRYPTLFRIVGLLLAFYYLGIIQRAKAVWESISSILVSSVQVSSDEDLFGYLSNFLADKYALRPNLALSAISNPIQENRRHRHDPDYEETAQKNARREAKLKYEQGQGTQYFIHRRRLFWVSRADGDGHTYVGNRYRRQEVLKFYCLGRSTGPIRELMEDVFRQNKEREKSLTVIRRPFSGGYSGKLAWSRLTAKRRRQLDTVILQESQTTEIIADVEEYMSEATKSFYANHGIPYRRGYLFHGPPGCGKTSFCLALASKFDLDVYILTLLDRDIQDSDLQSLLNQLPTPSLLLLEDIDEAGVTKRAKSFTAAVKAKKGKKNMPEGAVASIDDQDSDVEEEKPRTSVTLSGLLNAIDGVAAPEGHVLIMTTNKPYELDDALVRAGRVSVQVAFSKASKKQAEQIFLRMYIDLPAPLDEQNKFDLNQLAEEFGQQLPDGDFSPADLQDYLLVHKRDPKSAVAHLGKWMEDKYEEQRRKEGEKEAERQWKADKAKEKQKKWANDLKKALKEDEGEVSAGSEVDDEKLDKKIQELQVEVKASEAKAQVSSESITQAAETQKEGQEVTTGDGGASTQA